MKALYLKNPLTELKKLGFKKRQDGIFVKDQGTWCEWVKPEPRINGEFRCQINVGAPPPPSNSVLNEGRPD